MRILEVLDCFYPNYDGPVNVVANLARILNEKGLAEVEILVPDYPKNRVEIEGVKIHRAPSVKAPEGYRSAVPFVNTKVKNVIKNGNYDLINCHSCFYLGRYGVKYGKKYGVPTLMTLHTKYKDDFERIVKVKPLVNFMMRFIMKSINNADYMSTVSQGAAEVLRGYGYKGDHIEILRNATDLKKQTLSKEERQALRKEFGIGDEFLFLFVGRIVENKNVGFTLKVLNGLKQSGFKNFKFLIVGKGPFRSNLEKMIKEFGLEENVIFADRVGDREKLSKIYAMSDLFMFPSTFDTCGIVAIEAAANGLPSAMIKGACASELVVHGENGFTFENNLEDWVEGIKKIVVSDLSGVSKNAQESVYFSWEDATQKYFDYYIKLLDKTNKK